ncbi:hypothetical protein RUND412_004340 [Rhizina undulata]
MGFREVTFFLLATCVTSLPISIGPSNGYEREPPWVLNVARRGTWNLITNCVFTLVLCVWSTQHLDIPEEEENKSNPGRKMTVDKLKLAFHSLLYPDHVVAFAASQFWSVCKIRWKMTERYNETVPNESISLFREKWEILKSMFLKSNKCGGLTQELAFYAVMGGYSMEKHKEWRKYGENTLTPESFQILLKARFLPETVLNAKDIRDRSKIDFIGKEGDSSAEVESSVETSTEEIEIPARGQPKVSQQKDDSLAKVEPSSKTSTKVTELEEAPSQGQLEVSQQKDDSPAEVKPPVETLTEETETKETAAQGLEYPVQVFNNFSAQLDSFILRYGRYFRGIGAETPELQISGKEEFKTLQEALEEINKSEDMKNAILQPTDDNGRKIVKSILHTRRISAFRPWSYLSKSKYVELNHDSLVFFTLSLTILYGSAHVGVWNHDFPTPIERLLWRASSVAIAAGEILGLLAAIAAGWLHGKYYAIVKPVPIRMLINLSKY